MSQWPERNQRRLPNQRSIKNNHANTSNQASSGRQVCEAGLGALKDRDIVLDTQLNRPFNRCGALGSSFSSLVLLSHFKSNYKDLHGIILGTEEAAEKQTVSFEHFPFPSFLIRLPGHRLNFPLCLNTAQIFLKDTICLISPFLMVFYRFI